MTLGSELRLACIDSLAPPLFDLLDEDGQRRGFEPAVAALLADRLNRTLRWVPMPWDEMLPSVAAQKVDAVLCGQGIIPSREEVVDFTRPYAIFHEGVLVRRGSGLATVDDLRGRKVAAIAESTNMALADTFEGAEPVAFGGDNEDVYQEMLHALTDGTVDAVVDDDVVFVPLGASHPDYELAFTVRTANRWGIGVSPDRPDLRTSLDTALAETIAEGTHRAAWQEWMPTLEYPFGEDGGS